MNIDSIRGIDALMTEIVTMPNGTQIDTAIESGGFPEAGGSSTARQEGDQYILRCKRGDYIAPVPAIHDKLITTNYGTIEIKQIHVEGDLYALRCTGKIHGRTDI